MIYKVLLICLMSVLATIASQTPLKMPAQFSEKAKAAGDKCIKEAGAPSDTMENMFPWNLPQNEINEKFLSCLSSTLGLTNDDGSYITDKTMKVFAASDKFDEIKTVFAECNALKGKNKDDASYLITDCFFKKVPIKLLL